MADIKYISIVCPICGEEIGQFKNENDNKVGIHKLDVTHSKCNAGLYFFNGICHISLSGTPKDLQPVIEGLRDIGARLTKDGFNPKLELGSATAVRNVSKTCNKVTEPE